MTKAIVKIAKKKYTKTPATVYAELKIDKNIPIPETYSAAKEFVKRLQVGDSFSIKNRNHYSGLANHARKLGMGLRLRNLGTELRAWRLK